MTYDTLGEKESPPFVFQPDSLVSEHLIDMMFEGHVQSDLLQIVITDLKSKQQQIVLVGWKEGGLADLTYRIYSALIEGDEDVGVMETFFWLFWRGWAGVLDPNVIADLPNAEEATVALVAEGRPLRGEQLRTFRSTIVWAFANAVGLWGDTYSWRTGELAPSHLSLRQAMEAFIEQRMTILHGAGYADAPLA